jgi:hypothetical protein
MGISGKFLGDTKGNRDLHCNLSDGTGGGSGESHSGSPSGKFLGETKGNKDLPINRSSGTGGGAGGKFKSGGAY